MKFTPEKYSISDEPMKAFIDPLEIENFLKNSKADKLMVRDIIQKSLAKNRLSMGETAALLNVTEPDLIDEIKAGAQTLKTKVYGNRIVLFAPLYVGNKCANECSYCGFKASNKKAIRKTLDAIEIVKEVEALQDNGQKRLILVFGEHKEYSPEYIAEVTQQVYQVKKNNGEIRRVNINAAPLSIEGFRTVKEAGIGTYQVFQETYHPDMYKTYHLKGKKSDFEYRLTSLDRAQESGLDDVGIGALFGLYNWKYEVMGLIRHTNHLEACYNIGPHTISFPRIKDASTLTLGSRYFVSDQDFAKMIAILRLAVPYTGMILTAREPKTLRNELMCYGISQIDGGTKLELGAYANKNNLNTEQNLNKEQFKIGDERSLNEIIDELLDQNMLPSFCTACYRLGRTGEHFMEFSVPGFIKRYCTPNGILTLAEYLIDYAPHRTQEKGWKVIENNMKLVHSDKEREEIRKRIALIKQGKRDLYF